MMRVLSKAIGIRHTHTHTHTRTHTDTHTQTHTHTHTHTYTHTHTVTSSCHDDAYFGQFFWGTLRRLGRMGRET